MRIVIDSNNDNDIVDNDKGDEHIIKNCNDKYDDSNNDENKNCDTNGLTTSKLLSSLLPFLTTSIIITNNTNDIDDDTNGNENISNKNIKEKENLNLQY